MLDASTVFRCARVCSKYPPPPLSALRASSFCPRSARLCPRSAPLSSSSSSPPPSALRALFSLPALCAFPPSSPPPPPPPSALRALISSRAPRVPSFSPPPRWGVCLDSRLALPHDGRRLGCRVVGLSQSRRSVTMGRVHLVSSASRSSHPARFRQSRSLRSSSFESLAHSCRHP